MSVRTLFRAHGVHVLTRDEFKETEHPRAKSGEHGGQFTKGGLAGGGGSAGAGAAASLPKAETYQGQAAQQVSKMIALGLIDGTPPQQIAKEVAAYVATKNSKHISAYANKALRHVEHAHGLTAGSLGKVQTGSQIIVAKGKEADPPPARPEATAATKAIIARWATEKGQLVERKHPTATLAEVTNRSSAVLKEEKDWHEAGFRHATPEFLAAAVNTKPLRWVKVDHVATAHYMPGLHYISMGNPPLNHTEREMWTWRHEFGHAIDYNGNFNPSSADYDEARQRDAAKLIATAKVGRKAAQAMVVPQSNRTIEERASKHGLTVGDIEAYKGGGFVNRLMNLLDGTDRSEKAILSAYRSNGACPEHDYFQDFLGSMTLNTIGTGHSRDYYLRDKTMQNVEMFANYVALTQGEGGKVYRAVLHSLAPETCKGFDQIIENRANNPLQEARNASKP